MGSGLFFCWIPPRLYDRGQLRPPRVAPMEPKPPQEPINIGQVQLWQDGICQPFQTQPEYLEEKRPVGEEHGEKSPVGCFKHLLCGWNVLVLYHHPRIRRSSLQQTQKQNNLTEASSCLLLAHHKPSNLQHMFLFLKTNGVEKKQKWVRSVSLSGRPHHTRSICFIQLGPRTTDYTSFGLKHPDHVVFAQQRGSETTQKGGWKSKLCDMNVTAAGSWSPVASIREVIDRNISSYSSRNGSMMLV